eukprot:CAMPEP_0197649052 /NCGR_PEP_ID=MMETSP1338-20131121/28121_1 /TAXON_ID=43686 ORGANISM="Pelagodinium beii, Strain RCC1491" /NCGR_SAMPLE_ID=MMETSP1338 /ASSEMBLY_ACC=CAM_ASM_000754 /LENGTH=250 /DNA_ID=CAMNT_0043223153 /DNA_START=73 /DNA_END=825 /DNA_ORIENTATION=+
MAFLSMLLSSSLFLGANGVVTEKADLVKIQVYYEALCPACLWFFEHGMKPLLEKKGLQDVANFEFVPYGNSVTTGSTVTCQHGDKECQLDNLHACATKNLPQKDLPVFLTCAMGHGPSKTPQDVLSACGHADKIQSCFGNGQTQEAISMGIEFGKATETAGQEYTPYIKLNGAHSKLAEADLVQAVCSAYTGTPPEACTGVTKTLVRSQPAGEIEGLCYRDDAKVKAMAIAKERLEAEVGAAGVKIAGSA